MYNLLRGKPYTQLCKVWTSQLILPARRYQPILRNHIYNDLLDLGAVVL